MANSQTETALLRLKLAGDLNGALSDLTSARERKDRADGAVSAVLHSKARDVGTYNAARYRLLNEELSPNDRLSLVSNVNTLLAQVDETTKLVNNAKSEQGTARAEYQKKQDAVDALRRRLYDLLPLVDAEVMPPATGTHAA